MGRNSFIMSRFLKLFALLLVVVSACEKKPVPDPPEPEPEPTQKGFQYVKPTPKSWDKSKRSDMTYQLLLYSFADSDGDKWGDLKGLSDKIDYIDSLGASAIWISPIHPSMSYHGYDPLDYAAINPKYGTKEDFKNLVNKAHSKGIKIYLDFVLNHTGREHPWFKEASQSANSPFRSYYIFSQNPRSDISQGKIAMIATEGDNGYDAGQWFNISSGESQNLLFTLDWSNSTTPKITVGPSSEVDLDNPDKSTDGAKYLYFGDGVCKKFYTKGNGIYTLNVHFSSSWGFLIRTSNSEWAPGTKYGALNLNNTSIVYGVPFAIGSSSDNNKVYDIKLPGSSMFHSHFWTDWFADLNYGAVEKAENSATFKEMVEAVNGWIDLGIDGLRLDAVKHIYHNANSDENPQFLKKFYDEVNKYFRQSHGEDIYMIGEVLSEANEVARYYKGLPAFFEFSYWYRLKYAIENGIGRYFVKDLLSYKDLYKNYREDYIVATKLSNHDENRTCSDLGMSTPMTKLAGAVLLTSASSPYIYYGEELGYIGKKENGDEYVRAPMLWGDGYTTSYSDKVDPNLTQRVGSVIKQSGDTNSIYYTYLTFSHLRNTYNSLAKGNMTKHPYFNESNSSYPSVGAWYMKYDNETTLVIHNMSSAAVTFQMKDQYKNIIGRNGKVYINIDSVPYQVKMEGYSSIVFEL